MSRNTSLPSLPFAGDFFAFARERERIRRCRAAGQPWPWTNDPVFRDWRLCNVHREQDRTTAWFREHARADLSGWRAVEATIAFRFFNYIPTGEVILDLLRHGWDRSVAERRLRPLYEAKTVLWNAAYRLRGEDGRDKLTSTLDSIDDARRKLPALVSQWGESLESAWRDLKRVRLLGNLTAYEVVSDLRWTPVLREATDIDTWAAIGVGCANGLDFVRTGAVGDRDNSPGELPGALDMLRHLLEMSRDPEYWPFADAPWEMREAEHWACETAKIARARNGERLKRRFSPSVAKEPSLFDVTF